MSSLRKRVRIGKYAIPVLLLASLAIGTVAAVAYVILTFTVNISVSANPPVAFTDDDGVTLQNKFTISGFDIFPDVKTIDEDIGWNITNTDISLYSCSLRISAITDLTPSVDEIYIKAYESGTPESPVVEVTYSGTAPTSWVDFDADPSTSYRIWIEVTGLTGATGSASFDVEMKVNV